MIIASDTLEVSEVVANHMANANGQHLVVPDAIGFSVRETTQLLVDLKRETRDESERSAMRRSVDHAPRLSAGFYRGSGEALAYATAPNSRFSGVLRRWRFAVQDSLHPRGLLRGQRRLEDRAAVAAKLVRHIGRIGATDQDKDRGITRLYHRTDFADEGVGDANRLPPPFHIKRAARRAQCAATQGARCQCARCNRSTRPSGEGDGEGQSDQGSPQTTPGCAFTGGNL